MIFKDKGILKALWAGMFLLCALLGFVPQPEGANKWLLLGFGILFFVPPGLLLYQCRKSADLENLRLVRNLSIVSLGVTVALLVANILSMLAPQTVGDALYYILVVVSTPMVCCQYWVVSLFLWAALLWCSLFFTKELKK